MFGMGGDHIPVYKVTCNFSGENVSIKLLRKCITQIDGPTGCPGEVVLGIFYPIEVLLLISLVSSTGPFSPPIGWGCLLKHLQFMVRYIGDRHRGREVVMSENIPSRDYCMTDMERVLGKEPIAKVIERKAKLSRPGSKFVEFFVHSKPKVRASHLYCRFVRLKG